MLLLNYIMLYFKTKKKLSIIIQLILSFYPSILNAISLIAINLYLSHFIIASLHKEHS